MSRLPMTLPEALKVRPMRSLPSQRSASLEDRTALKTRGEIEAAIGAAITRFERDYMGRGPKDVQIHLIDDFLVCRLHGVFTAAEQQLVRSMTPVKGKELVRQVRTQLVETARPMLVGLIEEITGVNVVSLHYDISTVTGEEVVMFTLAESPHARDVKRN